MVTTTRPKSARDARIGQLRRSGPTGDAADVGAEADQLHHREDDGGPEGTAAAQHLEPAEQQSGGR